ncbi:hypothetical protein [Prosthecobacter sp.]|uniref:hypothetical protein n=1 Tax=Prosthecobacter sp. TaxID=1965333 RepID=UPI003783C074
MKTFSLLIVTIQLGLAVAASAFEPTTIETLQGKVYERCKIIKRDPDGVSFSHSRGTAKVLFSDLSAPMRNALGFDAVKAEAYEKEQVEARKAAEQARRERETKLAEAVIAAQARYAAQQPVVYVQQPNGGYMRSLAPVLGLGQIGTGYGFGGGFHHGHGYWRTGGWSPTVSSIGAGSGGVYVPQGHGLNFYGFPGVSWSPTLGYTNLNNNMPVIFGPLGQSGTSPGVVPGVGIPGHTTLPAHH